MEPEELTLAIMREDVQEVLKTIGKMPTTQTQLLNAYAKFTQEVKPDPQNEILNDLQEINRISIEKEFISMMADVYTEIQPHLKFYNKYGSLNYLDQKICSRLDKNIYPKSYRLHKFKDTPMLEMKEKQDIQLVDKLFAQLLDIIYQLLSTFQKYYEVEHDQRIPEVIFESLVRFMEENEDSYLIQEDRRSLAYEQERREKDGGNVNLEKVKEEMVKVLDKINKESCKDQNLVASTISAISKYTFSSGFNVLSEKIKAYNPFALTKKQITEEEKQRIEYELIKQLDPRLSHRQELNQTVIEFVMKLLPLRPQKILKIMTKEQKQKLQSAIGELLDQYEPVTQFFAPIVQELMGMFALNQAEGESMKLDHTEIRFIVLLFKVFERNYNPERRRFLFNFCELPSIKEKVDNPIGIVKFIQSQDVFSTEILNLLRTMPLKQKSQNKKHQLNSKKTDQISQAIEHELHRIHIYELTKKFKDYPLIQFERLTITPPKKVITIVFSGFMSQDSCKVEEWDKLLQTIYDSQVYSIRWESKTFGDMFDFAVGAGKNIVEANLKIGFLGNLGGPYLRALAIIRQIYKKYQNNPFNPAFQSAVKTGRFIAELLISSFKGHFINLVGFSLGTQLIKNILQGLAMRRQLSMINKVYMMGGVTDRTELENIVRNSDCSMSLVNLYSDKDSILKYLLKMCKRDIVPIGLNPVTEIDGHEIKNMDCSKFIHGHLAYRERLDILARLLNMKDD